MNNWQKEPLLLFNVGVEVGQLMFVFAALFVMVIINKVKLDWPAWVKKIPAYFMGSLAVFWLIERTASF